MPQANEAIADAIEDHVAVVETAEVALAALQPVLADVDAPVAAHQLGLGVAAGDKKRRPAEPGQQCDRARIDLRFGQRRQVGRTVARAEFVALAVRFHRAGVRRDACQQQRRHRQCTPSWRSPLRIHASALLAGTSTSRLPFDCIGDTNPARSICSIGRAARL